jgi:hypothetical protein
LAEHSQWPWPDEALARDGGEGVDDVLILYPGDETQLFRKPAARLTEIVVQHSNPALKPQTAASHKKL